MFILLIIGFIFDKLVFAGPPGKNVVSGESIVTVTIAGLTSAQTDGDISFVNLNDSVTLTGNLTISKPLRINSGGEIITSTHTLTFSTQPEAGDYQVFDVSGGGAVVGLSRVNAMWFGASPSASAANNVTYLGYSIAAMSDYSTWILPEGDYDTNALITFADLSGIKIYGNGRLEPTGAISGIFFDNIEESEIYVPIIWFAARDWTAGTYGVRVSGCQNSTFYIPDISRGRERGLWLAANDGTGLTYNTFYLGRILDAKYGIYGESSSSGYLKENNFHGGNIRLNTATKSAQSGSYGLYLTSSPSFAYGNLRFYGTTFEKLHNGCALAYGTNLTFITPRFEEIDDNYFEDIGKYFVWIPGESILDDTAWGKIDLDDNSARGVVIINGGSRDTAALGGIVSEGEYGGLTLFDREYIDDGVPANAYFKYGIADASFLRLYGNAEDYQYINKNYEGSAAPSSGTYRAGAMVWSTTRTTGNPMGWVCTSGGTRGTLNGGSTTGSTTNGLAVLTVNTATDLQVGQVLSVVGAATKRIKTIVGTVLTMESTYGATVTDAAVSFYNGTWTAMPNYP